MSVSGQDEINTYQEERVTVSTGGLTVAFWCWMALLALEVETVMIVARWIWRVCCSMAIVGRLKLVYRLEMMCRVAGGARPSGWR